MASRDKRLFRVTYQDDSVKHVDRRVLGQIVGATGRKLRAPHNWYKSPVKVEAVPEPAWEDVTAEFAGE